MFSGEYGVTLDDACRLSLPRSFRSALETNSVYVCRGREGCIWLFTAERWKKLAETVVVSTNPQSEEMASNPFFDEGRAYSRRFLGTSHQLDIDKNGRILIPPRLREYANLDKDCILLGQFDFIEIWDKDSYEEYLDASEEEYKAASRELGTRILKERELSNYGNSAHSGLAGGDNAISGS